MALINTHNTQCMHWHACRFTEWPDDALTAVAQKQLDRLPATSADQRANIVSICKTFHLDVRDLSEKYRSVTLLAADF